MTTMQIECDENPITPDTPEVKLAPEGQLNILGEHEAFLFYSGDLCRPSVTSVVQAQVDDEDDEFFNLTRADIAKRWRDLQAHRKELEDTPFQIAEVRALEKEEAQRRTLQAHPTTVIRIRFPNRYVLQGTFATDDTIGSVATFVQKYLADPDLKFYLLRTPPRTTLSSEGRLIDQDLIGSAVIYFGHDNSNTAGSTENPEFLKSELFTKLSCPNAIQEYLHNKSLSNSGASEEIEMTANDSSKQTSNQNQNSSQQSTEPAGSSQASTTASQSQRPGRPAQNAGVVPKWFRK